MRRKRRRSGAYCGGAGMPLGFPCERGSSAAAKKQVIGQLGVSGDNREGLFLGLGKSYLHYNRYDTLPEVFAQIEKITAGQILEVANEVLAPERLFCLIYE